MLPVLIYRCHAPLALVWNMHSAAYCQLDGIMRGRHASSADTLVPCISCIGMRHAFSSFRPLDRLLKIVITAPFCTMKTHEYAWIRWQWSYGDTWHFANQETDMLRPICWVSSKFILPSEDQGQSPRKMGFILVTQISCESQWFITCNCSGSYCFGALPHINAID